ncbi:MAG: pyruvate kinase [Candidatus Aenigmarchaeota archaeon]|nr:pyruvate kinase [Candidatus Aenigmarchaeota archaeon]
MAYLRKTKIICTLGPSSEKKETLLEMVKNGMNGARLNFSHGTIEEKEKKLNLLREINKTLDIPLFIISDLKGPEIRIDTGSKDLPVKIDDKIFFSIDKSKLNPDKAPYTVCLPIDALPKSGKIMVEDGLLEFEILKSDSKTAECVIRNAGLLKHNKGVNIPQTYERTEALTEKDWGDIEYSVKAGVDFIAASFVRNKKDIEKIADYVKNIKTKIIAKIEHQEALKNIDEIITASDSIMIARGDLGVEIPLESLPKTQYEIVKKCNEAGKPVIVATHMLNSMIENPRPTRAEVTDVANAVFMGADAVMLSGETANGKYPVESVTMMNKIATAIEGEIRNRINRYTSDSTAIPHIVGKAVAMSADSIGASAVISFTESGEAAKMLSRYRIKSPIYILTSNQAVCENLSLYWGTFPYLLTATGKLEDVIENGIRLLQEKGKITKGDKIVITTNIPSTNGSQRNIAEIRKI